MKINMTTKVAVFTIIAIALNYFRLKSQSYYSSVGVTNDFLIEMGVSMSFCYIALGAFLILYPFVSSAIDSFDRI
jgi:hypothetical protein